MDLAQQRCGHTYTETDEADRTHGKTCTAWRLSRPGSNGQEWRPCWSCKTEEPPKGERKE